MAQFDLHRNRNGASKARYPLLLDIQSDLLDPLATRVVIPLTPATGARTRRIDTLTPALRFGGKDYLLMTPLLAGIAARDLGPAVGNLGVDRDAIMAALDLLITGI
ncbi:MAG: CcdB family protein [Steroidobacteraceae bacterium]|nr:CcdB family protein [Steroidobacteraceae bacterium]